MRHNIDIDQELIKEALTLTGLKTKSQVVELGLQTIIRLEKQSRIKAWRGKLTHARD